MQWLNLPDLRELLAAILQRAGNYDRGGGWPAVDLQQLAQAGAMRWAIPRGHGGVDLSAIELHLRYEAIASASLAAALILSQRDSAVGFLAASSNRSLCDPLLQKLARNELFATIGIAQLTTSRQGGAPALLARRSGGGYKLDGVIPWSSGADRSQLIVSGAATDDGEQILFTLPTDAPGVSVEPPMPLVALSATHTSAVRCEHVFIDQAQLLAGPAPNVLGGRRKSLPIGQCFLALGLCAGGIRLIGEHDSDRGRTVRDRFLAQLRELREKVIEHCSLPGDSDPSRSAQMRGACSELAIRVVHSAVAIYKGNALLLDHPAQRLAREAMFLLVWSCPDPVIDCTVDLLSEHERAS